MKKRNAWLVLLLGLALLAAGFLLHRMLPEPRDAPLRALPYLCLGVGCGLFGHGAGELLAKRALKNDPELVRRQAIEAKDERNRAISSAAKARGYDLMTFAFGALMLFSVLMGADLLVVLAMVAVYLFIQFYALWWRFRLEKEM